MVAGIAGLVISEELDNGNTSYTNDWVRTAIVSSADDIDQYNPSYQGDLGSGRANAFNALAPPAAPQNLSVTGGTGNHPYVTWDDNSEPDLEGYHVFREDGGGVTQLTTNPIPNSEYLDTEMQTGFATQVGYFAKAVDSSAKVSDASNEDYIWVMPSAEEQYAYESRELTPTAYDLLPNSPNPFNPTTTLQYQLPE